MQIVFRGDVLSSSGYSTTNRLYVVGLIELGYDVKIVEQFEDKEFFLQFIKKDHADILREAIDKPIADKYIYFNRTTLDCFNPYANAVKTFVSTVWETSPFPHYWIENFNKIEADGIIVPSEFNHQMLEGNINKPVHLLREGLDLSDFYNLEHRMKTDNYKFLSIFQWLDRKGYDVLLEAYFREFNNHDDVSLIIKTSSLNYDVVPSSAILGYVTQLKRKYNKNLPVYILPTHLKYEEILKLYENSHAYVQASRAEGYCRPALEAMAADLPLIITGWGGQTDFAKPDNAHLIDYTLASVPQQWYSGDFQPYQVWAEPSIEHLQYLMRQVYENKNDTEEKKRKAKELSNQYDYVEIAKDLANILFS